MSGEKTIVLALTGASGGLYFLRTLRALLLGGHRVELVTSRFGLLTLKTETPGLSAAGGDLLDWFFAGPGRGLPRERVTTHGHQDQSAPIASGSARVDGMVIVPCSMKTLSGVAHGASSNLIERAADVCLKERRPLVLVTRETPHNLVHLRNMVAAAEAGAVILPASPAFYFGPQSFDDLGDFIAARALAVLGIEGPPLYTRWEGLPED